MSSNNVRLQAKITLAKVFSIAYKRDSEFVTSLQTYNGPFTVSLDQSGKITIDGEAGNLSFTTTSEEKSWLGVRVRRVRARFRQGDDYTKFSLSAHLAGANITLTGGVRLERLMQFCSGLLCRAARVVNVDSRWFGKEATRAFIGH